MKTGYNQATARDCSTMEQDLALCEAAGFDYIELRLDMLQDYLTRHTVEDLAAFFKTSRIRPHAFNALYIYSELFSEQDDPARQAALMAEFKLGCETGKAIGSEYFIIVPPLQRDPNGGPFIGNREDTYHNCVRILKKLSDMARPYNMKLCFELVGFERSSVRTVEEAVAIVQQVNRDNVGYVFDSYNIYLNGGTNNFSVMQQAEPEKIFAAHMMSADDVPAAQRGQDKRCFCGEGVVDTDNFLQTLKSMGYNGMVSVETFRPEYWQMQPEWVIQEAYRTTRACMEKNGCL